MKRPRSFLRFLGPGFITGSSDDDPAGIATYAQAGAMFGLATIWTALWTLPFMIAVQEMCARIARVTGRGLIANMRKHVSERTLIVIALLLLIANTLNVGADLGMMAASAQLIVPLPFWAWLGLMTVVTLVLQIFLPYKTYEKYLKWLCLSLLAYIALVFVLHVDWLQAISSTAIPQVLWTKDYWLMIVAILGTTISPYLYFWQASEEVEKQQADGCMDDDGRAEGNCDIKTSIQDRRIDVTVGMGFSNLVAWFIMITAATILHAQGMNSIETADQAASILRPIAGPIAEALFALGIMSTGLLTVPILTASASHALSDVIGNTASLSKKFHEAKIFYSIIILSTLTGITIHLFGLSMVRALIYASVVNALVAPIMLLFIVRLGDDNKIMGHWKNSRLSSFLGYATCLIMASSAVIWVILQVM